MINLKKRAMSASQICAQNQKEGTVKQDMFTAIKVHEFNISDMCKAIIIHVFLFLTCILLSKV